MRPVTTFLLVLLLFACKRDQDDRDDAAKPGSTRDTSKVYMAVYSEPEAVAVLQAINDAEIAAARVARDVSLNADVIRFANVLMADHRGISTLLSEALTKVGDAPRENATSTQIKTAGDSVAQALGALTSGFNNTFIEERIAAHQRALQELDTAIVPSIRRAEIRTLVEQIRPAIAAHLQRARQILAARRKAAAERGEGWESGLPAPQPQRPMPAPVVPPGPPRHDTLIPDTLEPPPITTTFEP